MPVRDAHNDHVFIATPMFGGVCHGIYTDSLASSIHTFMSANVPLTYSFRYNDALITKARDDLADEFMKTNCSHLMFIDADIGFDATDILQMLETDKDIICGVYPHKAINWEGVSQAASSGVPAERLNAYSGSFPVNLLNTEDKDTAIDLSDQQVVEVKSASTGFMLIKREVFEKISHEVPEYRTAAGSPPVQKVCKQFFNTSIDPGSNVLLSEDFHFCKLARDNGFKVWIAPGVNLSHAGTYTFTGRPIVLGK